MDNEHWEPNSNVLDFRNTADAQFRLAVRAYQRGKMKAALEHATISLAGGEPHANGILGAVYEKAESDGLRDYRKAMLYYEQGKDSAGVLECWLGVARLNYLGLGTDQNFLRAFECYKVVAKDSNHPVAHLMLGKMYLDGEGVGKNLTIAEKHLRIAQRAGYVFAFTYLGTLYARKRFYFSVLWYRLRAGLIAAKSISFGNKRLLRRI